MQKRSIVLLVLLLAVIVPLASADAPSQISATPIGYGETVNGQLASAQDYLFYRFQGTEGDSITVLLSSSAFDPLLQFGDQDANLLDENDNISGTDTNARLDLTLPYTGDFLIGVAGSAGGAFSLTLINNSAPSQPAALDGVDPQFQLVQVGVPLTGQLASAQDYIFYSYFGTQGETLTIDLQSNDFDTILQFGNAAADLIAENDDMSSGNLNSQLVVTLEYTGEYLIGIAGYNGGQFTLSVQSSGGASAGQGTTTPQQQPTSNPEPITIQYGDTIEGVAISQDVPVVYGFRGAAGDQITITVTSTAIDPFVILGDASANILAENDDISSQDLNSQLTFTLPANGQYLIGVLGYSAGPYTLTLNVSTGGTTPGTEVQATTGDVTIGEITNELPFFQVPLENVPAGARITIDLRATSGDLDTYLGLLYNDQLVAENDDREDGVLDSRIEYPNAEGGNYVVVATRYGFEDGATTGSFELSIDVSGGGTVSVGGGQIGNNNASAPDPTVNGYPPNNPRPQAAWTVLAYLGADNNLEPALVNDLNEFELAGGSDGTIQVVAFMDRSEEYGTSNDDWSEVRIYEVGPDVSGADGTATNGATIDTVHLASLGELDSSYGNNLTDFLVWGMTNYPAQNYAVILNDHGAAWIGIVSDDASSEQIPILTIPELAESFETALRVTGTPKFSMLINDACLMSSVEYYSGLSKFFDFIVGSPEITFNPGFDMTLLTNSLKQNPNISPVEFGTQVVDKFLVDMQNELPDVLDIVGVAVSDMSGMDRLTTAIENFAITFNSNPTAYATTLGQARSNAYVYSFWDQSADQSNVDLGSLMQQVVNNSRDQQLTAAAQEVLDAIDGVFVYGNAGEYLGGFTSFYNVYFPASSDEFIPFYFEMSPLQNWGEMLRNYYAALAPSGGRSAGSFLPTAPDEGTPVPNLSIASAPGVRPVVTVTNIYPPETNVNFPTFVSMEMVGRNIAFGDFTVDQLQPDGSYVRLETARIVTTVVEDGVVNFRNQWESGLDDFDFTWEVDLPVVTDGTTSANVMVTTRSGVASMVGRYQFPGSEIWQDVSIVFGDDSFVESVTAEDASNSGGVAPIQPVDGGIFQAYQFQVTADGRVNKVPGVEFVWSDQIRYDDMPAPSGDYQLGFLVEAFAGATGFAAANVTVNNDAINPDLLGYVDRDWGFRAVYPKDWFEYNWFPDSQWLQANNVEETRYFFVYPAYDDTNMQSAITNTAASYSFTPQGEARPITVAGRDALEFDFIYFINDVEWAGRGFALYIEELGFSLVFSAEMLDPVDLETFYPIMRDNLLVFDIFEVLAADTGAWEYEFIGAAEDIRIPVREDWLPSNSFESWTYYTPNGDPDAPTFAAFSEVAPSGDDMETATQLANQYASGNAGFSITETELYYGEVFTWSTVLFSYEGKLGRFHVTTDPSSGRTFAIWVETPQDSDIERIVRGTFDVMLDGFKLIGE